MLRSSGRLFHFSAIFPCVRFLLGHLRRLARCRDDAGEDQRDADPLVEAQILVEKHVSRDGDQREARAGVSRVLIVVLSW